jgi:high affinity Mn2+ porin
MRASIWAMQQEEGKKPVPSCWPFGSSICWAHRVAAVVICAATGAFVVDASAAEGDGTDVARSGESPAPPAWTPPWWSISGQFTNTTQWHDSFPSPYQGLNSLNPHANFAETTDATLYLGARLWSGASVFVDPELDEGFGLSNTLGVAGFPSGEAYKIGANAPYWRIPRLFVRQVINLGGDSKQVDAAQNQFAEMQTENSLILTLGKFSVVDVFDTNTYAHDPRSDFMNWTIIDSGVFDYAADSWGYTYGGSAEWTQDWWTARFGVFDLSTIPNGKQPDPDFGEFEAVAEFEARHDWGGHPGKLKLLVFANRGSMGSYQDAIAASVLTGKPPATADVRHFQTKTGLVINLEQEWSSDLGVFARLGANDGSKETFEFTDVNRSVSAGLSLKGSRWSRSDDKVGLALVQNRIDGDARNYFADGGLGLLVGDGKLNYGPENIAEMYYDARIIQGITLTLDYQRINHPAYNRDRGPVSIAAFRLHAEF